MHYHPSFRRRRARPWRVLLLLSVGCYGKLYAYDGATGRRE